MEEYAIHLMARIGRDPEPGPSASTRVKAAAKVIANARTPATPEAKA